MTIHGLQKLTLLDFPHKTACTVFTGGCNFRCPFCHNSELVLRPGQVPAIPEEEFFSLLEKRKHTLEGVCITGGEPMLQKDLPLFCYEGECPMTIKDALKKTARPKTVSVVVGAEGGFSPEEADEIGRAHV